MFRKKKIRKQWFYRLKEEPLHHACTSENLVYLRGVVVFYSVYNIIGPRNSINNKEHEWINILRMN